MFITATIKMEAESKEELAESLAAHYEECKAHFEELKKGGVFGPPDHVKINYMIVGGGWRNMQQEVPANQLSPARPTLDASE